MLNKNPTIYTIINIWNQVLLVPTTIQAVFDKRLQGMIFYCSSQECQA
jgi:hypothetical protein